MIAGAESVSSTALRAFDRRKEFRRKIEQAAANLERQKRGLLVLPRVAPIPPEAVAAETDPPALAVCPHCCGNLLPAGEGRPGPLTIRDIKLAVCREFGVKFVDLAGPRRFKDLTFARQIAMWLCKDLLWMKSHPAIGREFGGRDHTTSLHASQVVPGKLAAAPWAVKKVEAVRAALAARE